MTKAGLCSVTLRDLPPDEVAAAARRAGLAAIEWGADVHAPPGDRSRLARCRAAARDHGLEVVSYGSYWRAGSSDLGEGERVLAAAEELGCRRIRIWAGTSGSASTDAAGRTKVVASIQALADLAAARGLELALEHHPDTLSDTVQMTLRLLGEIGSPSVSTYWQPDVGRSASACVSELSLLLEQAPERTSAVHVFSWWPRTERLPLDARADLWGPALRAITARAPWCDALIEFVPADSVRAVVRDGATLTRWLQESGQS